MRQKHMMPTSNMSHLVSFSCSFSFWPFCVRICRISTRTSLACEEQQFDESKEDQDMCGDLAIISRVLCTGHLLVQGVLENLANVLKILKFLHAPTQGTWGAPIFVRTSLIDTGILEDQCFLTYVRPMAIEEQ